MESLVNKNIVDGLNGGDKLSFDAVYELFFSSLCYFANKITQDSDVSCDLVQEVFLTVWDKKIKFESPEHLKSFLYRSVQNKALTYVDKQNTHKRIEGKILNSSPRYEEGDIELFEIESNVMEQINAAINELPEECRKIFKMSYLENMTVKSIEEQLHIAASTIMTQRKRAKQYLRKRFKNSKLILYILTSTINF